MQRCGCRIFIEWLFKVAFVVLLMDICINFGFLLNFEQSVGRTKAHFNEVSAVFMTEGNTTTLKPYNTWFTQANFHKVKNHAHKFVTQPEHRQLVEIHVMLFFYFLYLVFAWKNTGVLVDDQEDASKKSKGGNPDKTLIVCIMNLLVVPYHYHVPLHQVMTIYPSGATHVVATFRHLSGEIAKDLDPRTAPPPMEVRFEIDRHDFYSAEEFCKYVKVYQAEHGGGKQREGGATPRSRK